ncbi:MAG: T9SS type A sorting domain-containing protein, partial [candidate division Zixibacteria bacterium]|nr:T9SS type A sorting domain-containing protein [candidate division Zixibacteria bacterium]
YGACNPQSATYIENYINSGGGAIVTDGAPYFLAGQSRNLSSIKHWFGAGYYPNDNDTVSVIVDHPFGTPLVSGDTLHQDYPRCNWGAAASDLQMGAHPVAQYRGRCGNNIAAFYYTYGSGKVYFSYTLFYPHENHTVLLKAAMEWANACKVEGPGSVSGAVSDSLGGVLGVTVDLFDSTGSLAEFTYTDVSGFFEFDSVDPGDYTVSIVTPLGYVADFESRPVTVTMNADSVVNFTLHRLEMVPSQRSMGYWKHQVNVHLSGKGHAQESQTDMSNYMSLIEEHFNDNLANSITIFEVPQPATQTDSLEALKDLLTVKGNAGMNAKARQQLMALLLNVVSLKLDQTASISEDSANVSQAITYSNQVITDSDPTNDEIAKDIADQINNGVLVASGIIPLTTPDIIYKGTEDQIAQTPSRPKQFSLEQNYPNPFNPACNIEYALPTDCQVTLSIYNILGQKVRVLVDEYQSTGNKSVTWDGKDDQGQEVTSGVYFYRIQAGDFVQSKKMVLIK